MWWTKLATRQLFTVGPTLNTHYRIVSYRIGPHSK